MFGKIGSFFKEAVLGVFEIFGETFVSAPAPKKDPAAAPAVGAGLSPAAPPGEAFEPQRPAAATPCEAVGAAESDDAAPAEADANPHVGATGRAGGAEPRKSVRIGRGKSRASAAVANGKSGERAAADDGSAQNSGEPPASESPVAQRYRTLKAEGLTAKEANEFSRSAKKYALYKHLSTTRPREGEETHWEMLKEFDRKAALHLARVEKAGEDAAGFRLQVAAARDALIAKYLGDENGRADGRARRSSKAKPQASSQQDMGDAEAIAKMIGLEKF